MKKKEREKAIEKKKRPKGKVRGTTEERGKKKGKIKKEKFLEKKIKKEKETKKREIKKVEPTRKNVKKIEKIMFPPRKRGERVKKKKPNFSRQDVHLRKKLKEKWRNPRGIDSKKHVKKRGKGKVPKIGYKNPEVERGLIKGLRPKHVYNSLQLNTISREEEGVIIDKGVGRKKRNNLIKEANKLKIIILNPRKGEL